MCVPKRMYTFRNLCLLNQGGGEGSNYGQRVSHLTVEVRRSSVSCIHPCGSGMWFQYWAIWGNRRGMCWVECLCVVGYRAGYAGDRLLVKRVMRGWVLRNGTNEDETKTRCGRFLPKTGDNHLRTQKVRIRQVTHTHTHWNSPVSTSDIQFVGNTEKQKYNP